MYTIRIQYSGCREPALLEGDYDKCMHLAHSTQAFPMDVMTIEVWDTDTLDTRYAWKSPHWDD